MPVSPVTASLPANLAAGTAALPLSRRSVLAAGALGLLTAGCSFPGSDDDRDTGGATDGPRTGTDADVAVATEALTAIRQVRQALAATTTRFADLAEGFTALAAMHVAHETSLVDAVPSRGQATPGGSSYAVPRQRARALAGLGRLEDQLHTTLDALALRARSGDFARLLASMGAGIAQQRTGWPR